MLREVYPERCRRARKDTGENRWTLVCTGHAAVPDKGRVRITPNYLTWELPLAILFVFSDRKGSGKTCLVMALLSLLRQQGKSGAYYKPFSAAPEGDPDVAAVSAGFPDLEIPSPVALPAALTPELGRQVGGGGKSILTSSWIWQGPIWTGWTCAQPGCERLTFGEPA